VNISLNGSVILNYGSGSEILNYGLRITVCGKWKRPSNS